MAETSLDEHEADHVQALATDLHARLYPKTVVVTLGRLGALGYTCAGTSSTLDVPLLILGDKPIRVRGVVPPRRCARAACSP